MLKMQSKDNQTVLNDADFPIEGIPLLWVLWDWPLVQFCEERVGGGLFPILGQSKSYETYLEKEPHCGTELESVDQIFEARWVGHINRI